MQLNSCIAYIDVIHGMINYVCSLDITNVDAIYRSVHILTFNHK